MKEQFVTYDVAKRLKELGFNEPCLGWIAQDEFLSTGIREVKNSDCAPKHCASPLWQQAIDWLRETKKITVGLVPYYDYFYYIIKDFNTGSEITSDEHIEKAHSILRQEAVEKALTLIE